MKKTWPAPAWRLGLCLSFVACAALTACGGGGEESTQADEPAALPKSQASAQVVTPASGEAAWRIDTPLSLKLVDASGKPISGPLSCAAKDPALATVATDCSTFRAERIGAIDITVTAQGQSAVATITGVPAAHWTGVHGPASSAGNGDDVLVRLGDGRVLAWGGNPGGALGQNQGAATLSHVNLPSPVLDASGKTDLKRIYRVSAGYNAALAVTRDGEVLAWGNNDSHQLGTDAAAYVNGALLPIFVPSVSKSGGLNHVVQAENGDRGAVALIDDGTVIGWGSWPADGTANSSTLPAGILRPDGGGLLRNIVSVSAGRTFFLALDRNGMVYAWGNSMPGTGNLGDGLTTSRQVKTPVIVQKQDGGPLTDIVQISAGYLFSLALDSSGQVWAWGGNNWGQLGQGYSSPSSQGTPWAVRVLSTDGKTPLSQVQMVAAGGIHALALKDDGSVLAWGYGAGGQLGDGANRPAGGQATLPRPLVDVTGLPGLDGVVSIAAGYNQSQALTRDGQVLTWGGSFGGALGRTSADDATPAPALGEDGIGTLTLRPTDYPNLTQRAR